jgi:hypothetical protein
VTAAPRVRNRPAPSAPRDYHFPHFDRRVLSNGLRLIVATVPKLPLITVAAVVDAGAVCDPGGREGLAELAAKLRSRELPQRGCRADRSFREFGVLRSMQPQIGIRRP